MRALAHALALAIVFVVVLAAIAAASAIVAIAVPNVLQVQPNESLVWTQLDPAAWAFHMGLGPASWARIGAFSTAFACLAFLCCTVLVAGLLLFGRRAKRRDRSTGDDSRLMQELYRRSAQMEERLESLETILLARSGSASGALRGRHASKRN